MNYILLRKLLEDSKLGKARIAEMAGISRTTLDNAINGADIKISTLENLSKVLGICTSVLFNDDTTCGSSVNVSGTINGGQNVANYSCKHEVRPMLLEKIVGNIRKIMNDRNLTQYTIAQYIGTSESQCSKIMKGDVKLTIPQLENLARNLSISVIDIITYPDVYVKNLNKNTERDPVEAILQIKLNRDKKDQVLKLVFGENNIEIFNN